jgi:hypothetical protein
VISRIRAGESGGRETLAERLGAGSFLARFLQIFQTRPGVIGGFATSLCLVLLIGVVMADRPDGLSAAGDPGNGQTVSGDAGLAAAASLAPPDANSGIAISSNSVASLQPVATLFGSEQNPLFQTAAFVPSGQASGQ